VVLTANASSPPGIAARPEAPLSGAQVRAKMIMPVGCGANAENALIKGQSLGKEIIFTGVAMRREVLTGLCLCGPACAF
jgi:hypothetical protein